MSEVSSAPVLAISIDNGPIKIVTLTEGVTTIGRSVDNVLEIPDPNMSRRHCVLEQRETGEVVLTDCNSSNGTKINGERVISQELKARDEIDLGSTKIRFATSRRELEQMGLTLPLEARLPEKRPPRRPRRGRPSDTLHDSGPAGAKTGTGDMHRSAEAHVLAHERDDLRKLLAITKELNQVHDLRRLLETIIDAAIELMAAERGFLILLHDGQMRIEIARNMGQTSINDSSLAFSTQVCKQVIEGGEAVLTTDAQADNHFGRFKSVVGLNLRSIICVPFRIKSEIFGTVYLDASHAGAFSLRDVALLEAFSDQAGLAIENARLLKAAKQRERIEQELRIASQIQRKLLPRQVPDVPGLELYGWMHSAKEVGGDYYDFIPSKDGKSLYFCVGDVSGKGVPAGLVMASARSALHSLIEAGVGSTRDIVLSLNRFLCADLDQEMFLSFVLMHYDPSDGSIRYTGAGHENILIWRQKTGELEVLRTGGRVLGVTTRAEEQFSEQALDLGLGDTIVLYTDGVTETLNDQRQQYDLERLVSAARRHGGQAPKQTLHAILSEVLRFKGRVNQRDDITMLVVRRSPPGSSGNAASQTEQHAHVADEPTRHRGIRRPSSLLD